jgi:cytochrome oxidase Cu insertion factor (SCO1/SenC/PrrC family)
MKTVKMLTAVLILAFALPALAVNFKVEDMKGKKVTGKQYLGNVLVMLACDKLACKDLKKHIETVYDKYGHNKEFDWLGVVKMPDGIPNLGPARKLAEKGVRSTYKEVEKSIKARMKKNKESEDKNRKNEFHLIIDWDKEVLKAAKLRKMNNKVRMVLINRKGEVVHKYSVGDMDKLFKDIEKALEEK